MKSRVLNNLKDFSEIQIKDSPTEMFQQVKKELAFSSEQIIILAKERLNLLLHNYSFFQIETLDSFNHHIVRSFYKELNLDPDFRVVIDSEEILDQSVSRIFENIENNVEISNLVKNFSIKKISEGKSWDVEFDLKEFNAGDYAESVAAKNVAENITMVLYPNDANENGKALRLRQQYLLASASLQDVLELWVGRHGHDFTNFTAKNCFQLKLVQYLGIILKMLNKTFSNN